MWEGVGLEKEEPRLPACPARGPGSRGSAAEERRRCPEGGGPAGPPLRSAAEGSEQISRVEVTGGLRACPMCGYQRGFHISFIARQDTNSLGLILVCAGCGERFDIGKIMWHAPADVEPGACPRPRGPRKRASTRC